jgi:drug/metabolite transporter (DMT)-like permease
MSGSSCHRQAVARALAVTVLWSSSWVLIRRGLGPNLGPVGFAGLRYLVAAVVLTAWTLGKASERRALARLDRRRWVELIGLGLVFYFAAQGAQFVAIASQPAASSSLVLSFTPVLVAMASGASLGEKPASHQMLGIGLLVAGTALYTGGSLGFTPTGLTAALVGLAANTGGALLGRAINRRLDLSSGLVTAVSMMAGALALAGTGLMVEGVPSVSRSQAATVLWLALVNTALAFKWWNQSLRAITATQAAVINNSMLLQIALLGWVFLGEPLSAVEVVGVGLVSVGVTLGSIRRGVRTGAGAVPRGSVHRFRG